MGTSELVEKILSDGQARVAAIQAERDQALAKIHERTANQVAAIKAEYAERTRRDCGTVLERARSRARLEQRNAVLAARWKMLDLVAERARDRLLADPGYAGMVSGLVERYARPESVVRLSPKDMQALGARLTAKLGAPAAIAGGVLIRTGKVELNFSLEENLLQLRDDLAGELAGILFP